MHNEHRGQKPQRSASASSNRTIIKRVEHLKGSYDRSNSKRNGGGFSRGGGAGRSFGRPRRGNANPGLSIDPARFVNKAVVEEHTEVYAPEHTFSDFPFGDLIKTNIAAKGYVLPTPIQDQSIMHVLKGEDIVGIANTGTGKTAAFLLPLIDKVLKNPNEKILIMVPTRELATQIDDELRAFAKGSGLFSVVCVGGTGMGNQIRELRHRHNFVIGTPGRLKDHMENRNLDLSTFNTVVLDEADRMLDMGFIGDMRFMMAKMPTERQTLFFSATLSKEIEALIHDFLRNPARVSVKTRDTSKNVDQDIIRVKHAEKFDVLASLLKEPEYEKVLVFSRTKHGAEKLGAMLSREGIPAESIHGDKQQSQRQRALKAFKDGKARVLVATDVAARGLDIPNVSHVINYDVPATYEDYVHRIGRTGRAERKGKALTFVE